MLLMDGVRYVLHEYNNEAELESMMAEHYENIFGTDSLYFPDIRHKLIAASVNTIPDAFAITFDPPIWWVVEIERSIHPVRAHMIDQLGGFVAALKNTNTRYQLIRGLVGKLEQAVKSSPKMKGIIDRKTDEPYKFLTNLIEQTPEIAVIIDKKVPELSDAIAALGIKPKILEFATFYREGVGLAVHIHQFEPLVKKPVVERENILEGQPVGTSRVFLRVRPVDAKHYKVILMTDDQRHLFPPPGANFEIEADGVVWSVHMGKAETTSNDIQGLRKWFRSHPEFEGGGKVAIEILQPQRRYKLEILKE